MKCADEWWQERGKKEALVSAAVLSIGLADSSSAIWFWYNSVVCRTLSQYSSWKSLLSESRIGSGSTCKTTGTWRDLDRLLDEGPETSQGDVVEDIVSCEASESLW